jgi:hypothetical protein
VRQLRQGDAGDDLRPRGWGDLLGLLRFGEQDVSERTQKAWIPIAQQSPPLNVMIDFARFPMMPGDMEPWFGIGMHDLYFEAMEPQPTHWRIRDMPVPIPDPRDTEISRLTARIAKLEKALKPFAAMAPVFPDDTGYVVCRVRACDDLDLKITGADLHAAARTTLEASGRGGEK